LILYKLRKGKVYFSPSPHLAVDVPLLIADVCCPVFQKKINLPSVSHCKRVLLRYWFGSKHAAIPLHFFAIRAKAHLSADWKRFCNMLHFASDAE